MCGVEKDFAKQMTIPIALTIAGSDSGGGAGIQADLKTFHQFGVFGTSVITAVTAQNTTGVWAMAEIAPHLVQEQIRAVAEDLPPAATKTGMLPTADIAEAAAAGIREHDLPNLVVDPVMVATSGDRLIDASAVRTIVEHLLPLATLVTPNVPEAAWLTGHTIADADAMAGAGRALLETGAAAALVKGGHLSGPETVDILVTGTDTVSFRHPRLDSRHTHGTGCTLSAAVAAGLARGNTLTDAVRDALDFVHRAIDSAPGLGAGHGPLNHFVARSS